MQKTLRIICTHVRVCACVRVQANIRPALCTPRFTRSYVHLPAATYARLRAATTVVRCRVTAADIPRCASAVRTSPALISSSRRELPYPCGMASDRPPSSIRRKISRCWRAKSRPQRPVGSPATLPGTAQCPGPRAQFTTVCGGAAASAGGGVGSAPSAEQQRGRTCT